VLSVEIVEGSVEGLDMRSLLVLAPALSPTAALDDAICEMGQGDFECLAVVEDGAVRGICAPKQLLGSRFGDQVTQALP